MLAHSAALFYTWSGRRRILRASATERCTAEVDACNLIKTIWQ